MPSTGHMPLRTVSVHENDFGLLGHVKRVGRKAEMGKQKAVEQCSALLSQRKPEAYATPAPLGESAPCNAALHRLVQKTRPTNIGSFASFVVSLTWDSLIIFPVHLSSFPLLRYAERSRFYSRSKGMAAHWSDSFSVLVPPYMMSPG